MEYLIIAIIAFFIAAVTLFSGFGLGTVLTPVFILFFPVPIAISITAIVHFLNNLFKLFLLGKFWNKEVIIKFGIPAVIAAFIGAELLSEISKTTFIIHYQLFSHVFKVSLVNFIIGIIILFFAIFESLPNLEKISLNKKYLYIGGILSGFFGGLAGNQGAFRSIFLLKTGLTKEQYISTNVIIACMVDIVRLTIYGANFLSLKAMNNIPILATATAFAFLGSYFAQKFIHKITINLIRITVIVLLFGISLGLITGLI